MWGCSISFWVVDETYNAFDLDRYQAASVYSVKLFLSVIFSSIWHHCILERSLVLSFILTVIWYTCLFSWAHLKGLNDALHSNIIIWFPKIWNLSLFLYSGQLPPGGLTASDNDSALLSAIAISLGLLLGPAFTDHLWNDSLSCWMRKGLKHRIMILFNTICKLTSSSTGTLKTAYAWHLLTQQRLCSAEVIFLFLSIAPVSGSNFCRITFLSDLLLRQ